MNAKMGGDPWVIQGMPLLNKPASIIGYDVFHKKGKKSILAYNASVNQFGTKFWSRTVEQAEREEIAQELEKIVTDGLEAFKTANTIYPKQLIFMRDGVGEGQKAIVMKQELEQIK